ncbi:unnamed protein product [Diatraea saccharalis]|uniref:von Hippel-Lindau disease tumour suppressor beta domain-containing protein n=1 Tax=Diatraea saccharalis TaxID=40085 RepID=A0A9N9RB05_9NEOP|nr:unnamed protein product [Diatraea saccharalis]
MAVNGENSEFIYEVDEKGNRVIVKSLNSDHRVYIRFINSLVTRPVDVWWRDFQGRRRFYMRMLPRTYFDVTTYLTHPWEFKDPATNENFLINNKKIFRVPSNLEGTQHRTNWIITVNVRTLRDTVLLALALRLGDLSKVPLLGLPQELSNDLTTLINSILNTPAPPPRHG